MPMPRFRYTIRQMMIAVAVGTVGPFLLYAIDGLWPGPRINGRIELEIDVISLRGRELVGLAYNYLQDDGDPDVIPPDVAFRDAIWEYRRLPYFGVRTGSHYGGFLFPRRVYSGQERGYRWLRMDFADGTWEYAVINIPELKRPPKPMVVIVD